MDILGNLYHYHLIFTFSLAFIFIGSYFTNLLQSNAPSFVTPIPTAEEREALDSIQTFRETYPKFSQLNNLTLATELSKKFRAYETTLFNVEKYELKKVAAVRSYKDSENKNNFLIALSGGLKTLGSILLIFGIPVYLAVWFFFWCFKTLRKP